MDTLSLNDCKVIDGVLTYSLPIQQMQFGKKFDVIGACNDTCACKNWILFASLLCFHSKDCLVIAI